MTSDPLHYLFPREWEFHFTGETMDFETHVRCSHCGKQLFYSESFRVNKYIGQNYQVEYHFCNEKEANEFYLNKLRTGGM